MANQPNIGGEVEVNFIKGRMNKDFDRRVIPDGEYIDAMNIRIGSTENDTIGAIQNTKGNIKLTELQYNGSPLVDAVCIGAFEDGSNETLYWFVTKPGIVDMIVSYNTNNNVLKYNATSNDGVLNFDTTYLINSIDKIDDLLFWTDGLNPPRKINIKKNYTNPRAKDVNVIVAPPLSSPKLTMVNVAGEENYMIERFISFSYRYKYKDNEYSALSQFSETSFEPGTFSLDYSTYTNQAMQNIFNSVIVGFNTGDYNVIGIDLCFKLSDSNIINVIERFNKKEQGWLDDTEQSISFNNKKIYTTLTESELLRLYDNVPRTAISQTVMGNRLVYGNYVDGYDIDTELDYSLEVINEVIGYVEVPYELVNGVNYTIDPTNSVTSENSAVTIDLTGIDLSEGSLFSMSFNLLHQSFSGYAGYNDPPDSVAPTNEFVYNFVFTLRRDYTSVYDLATSQEFLDAISTHEPYADCSNGFSVTDNFNCSIITKGIFPPFTTPWEEVGSGIYNSNGGFTITSSVGSDILQVQVPAVKFRIEDPDNLGTYFYAYEYFRNATFDSAFSKIGARQSLHSNRGYEVGIVYMDEYLRSTTVLVDTLNTVFIPSNASDKKNYIRATVNNLAPSWATKYKFVVKPSKTKYEVVYSNQFYIADTGLTWFRLQGDNRSKVQENSTLIVKSDSNGVVENLVKTKVLELKSQAEDFINGNKNEDGVLIVEPEGMYMALKATNFAADYKPNSFIDYGNIQTGRTSVYPCHIDNPEYDDTAPISPTNLPYIPYDIPAGSTVSIYFKLERFSRGSRCGGSQYTFDKTFVASQDYASLFDFVEGDHIDFGSGTYYGGENPNENVQTHTLEEWFECSNIFTRYQCHLPYIPFVNQYQFQEDTESGRLFLVVTAGQPACESPSPRATRTDIHVIVQRAVSLIVFETEAFDADGEIYYEGSDSFDIVDGLHMSGTSASDVDQTSSNPAIVELNFFNCFSFGNGVESYKINDSLIGSPFYLGSRVTAVSQEEYKESDRYAGLTYSGIYNAETNINKLNEFNLALANWKDCEKSFGPINKLFARKTDILVLQEDKISYVLAGKNLLSDAAAGGAIASIPEVLGTQIARIENYGISNNPESCGVYGQDVYFTDAKRTAVIKLKGGSAQADELVPISMLGMRGWFRSEFKNTLNNQKLGGYDPYLSEYVLSLNENKLPIPTETFDCGSIISQKMFIGSYEFELNLNDVSGTVSFDCTVTEGLVNILMIYDESEVINETISEFTTFSFQKGSIRPETVTIIITCDVESSYALTTYCPASPRITVGRLVVNSEGNVDQTIHNNYNWTLGSFTSPTSSDAILLEADGISLYSFNTEMASVGVIPAIGSTIYIDSTKSSLDTFIFDAEFNSFKYLVTDKTFNESQVPDLLLEANIATPIINPISGKYSSTFVYDNPLELPYLYLIWDYRIPDYSILDYSPEDYSTNP